MDTNGKSSTGLTNQQIAQQLFEYITTKKFAPWRSNFLETVKTCYRFKELQQWDSLDASKLAEYGVPEIAVDRINRGLDTIKGIWVNTGAKKKVVKRELGDERTAELLDAVLDYVVNDTDFPDAEEDSFDNLLTTGLGIRKEGYDPEGDGGFGKFWSQSLNIEDVYMGFTRKRDYSDSNWYCHHTIKTYEMAVSEMPEFAPVFEGLKQRLQTEWDKMKDSTGGTVTSVTRDYGSKVGATDQYAYDDMIDFWEFWVQKIVPLQKVARIGFNPMTQQLVQEVIVVPQDYELAEGEQLVAHTFEEEWWQYLVAGNERAHELLGEPKKSKYGTHPFVFECAERKKDGSPRGYVEVVIPHQIRVNLAWAQKIAFNNKSIKSPIVVRGVTDMSKVLQQSAIGAVLMLKQGEEVLNVNTVPNVNLQAIEEGNMARSDMDFAAAATEESMRGVASSGESGIKMSLRQNASITPLNKWVKAHSRAELTAYKKRLKMVITEWGDKPAQLARIVGVQKFMELLQPEVNPMTGQIIELPLQMPVQIDAAQYDVKIEEQSVSDFNKQQTFNAAVTIQGMNPMGVFDMEYIISNAPMSDIDGAIASYRKHREDIVNQLMMQVQMLQSENQEIRKAIPKEKPENQGQKGRTASQAGKRSMVGGQNGVMGLG